MKTILAFSMLLIATTLATKTISGDWDSPRLTDSVRAGETFHISLKSNPTTGFKWEVKSKPLHCEYTSVDAYGEFIEPADGAMGSPGKQVFNFLAKTAGEEHITLVYERPWTKEGSKTLEIVVKIS